jgi:hypothetical protein
MVVRQRVKVLHALSLPQSLAPVPEGSRDEGASWQAVYSIASAADLPGFPLQVPDRGGDASNGPNATVSSHPAGSLRP